MHYMYVQRVLVDFGRPYYRCTLIGLLWNVFLASSEILVPSLFWASSKKDRDLNTTAVCIEKHWQLINEQ